MNPVQILNDEIVKVYDYTEFWTIVGVVFGVVLICAIILFVHARILKKKLNNKQQKTD